MIYRFTRTYIVAAIVFLVFLCTIQLLRFQAVASASSQPHLVTGWKDWMWPAYDTDLPTTGSSDEQSDKGWQTETTTIPAGAAHTPLVPAVAVDPESTAAPESNEAPAPEKEKTPYPMSAWGAKPLPALNTTFHVPSDIYYNPKGPQPDQVVLVTATDGKGHNGGIQNIIEQTSENRKAYCDYHGYHHHFVNISKFDLYGAHPVWKKLPAIVDAFNTYPDAQWVFFLDLDAIIMSPKQDLNSLVLSHEGMRKSLALNTELHGSSLEPLGYWTPAEPDYENIDIMIAQDHNGINAGSFFLRRSTFTQWLLDMWADPFFMRMDWPGQEQETLLHFVKHHHIFRKHLGLIKQRVANAFCEGDENMRWFEGDLVVHFAGCWVSDMCQERWVEFWAKRGTV